MKIISTDQRMELGSKNKIILDGNTTNWHLTEWVPKRVWELYGNHSLLLLDADTVALAQFVREWFDVSMDMNTWFFGGSLQYRGHRPWGTKIGSKMSMHKYDGAFDLSASNAKALPADRIRREELDNEKEFMAAGLTRIEHPKFAPTWGHHDRKITLMDTIKIVKPARAINIRGEKTHAKKTA